MLGGGIAGLRVAMTLEKKIRSMVGWEIMLIDENDYHQYRYRIHEVVGGRATPSEVIVPFKRLLQDSKMEFVQAQVRDIDPSSNLVHTDLGLVYYDILVVALGSHPEFYGIPGLRENSLTLGSIEDAVRLRLEVEKLFTTSGMGPLPPIVVGGGGAVGVELLAELFELTEALRKKRAAKEAVELVLIEAREKLLPGLDPWISERITEKLKSMGVRLILGDRIVRAGRGYIDLISGKRISFSLLVWTGGNSRDPGCGAYLKVGSRRLCTDQFSRAHGLRRVYAVGDCALVVDPVTGEILSPSAHLALEQADLVAKNVFSDLTGAPKTDFTPTPAGNVMSIGGRDAVGVLYGVPVGGLLAVLIKKLVHLRYVWSIAGLGLLLRGKKISRRAARKLVQSVKEREKRQLADDVLAPMIPVTRKDVR